MSVMVSPDAASKRGERSSTSVRGFSFSISFVREVGIIVLAAYIYFFVRGLIHAREPEAMDNARWLVSQERLLASSTSFASRR